MAPSTRWSAGIPSATIELVLEAVRAIDDGTAILFAQFSMERILPGSAAAHPAPVVGPASEGVLRLRALLTGR